MSYQLQRTTLSKDFYNGPSRRGFVSGLITSFASEHGLSIFYVTYLHDDYGKGNVTLELIGKGWDRDKVYISAPLDEITKALYWVKLNNQHVEFGKHLIGYNNDQFVLNYATIEIEAKMKVDPELYIKMAKQILPV